jgi:hypothetical protein
MKLHEITRKMKIINRCPGLNLLCIIGFLSIYAVVSPGCTASRYSFKTEKDSLLIRVNENPDMIKYYAMQPQNPPEPVSDSKSRGLLDIIGQASSAAVSGVVALVDMEKAKYSANYQNSLGQCYFYSQISENSALDPAGMQFSGFTVVRRFRNDLGKTDTALYAKFVVDESNPYEIINNSMFRLQLQELKVNYAKAKIMSRKWYQPWTWFMAYKFPYLNMDFEITLTASWVTREGVLFSDMQVGKFLLPLKNIPLDKKDPAHAKFYAGLKKHTVTGKSFLVPRSFGYYYSPKHQLKPSFGQGSYNIAVKVNESSRSNSVQTMLFDNSTDIIQQAGNGIPGSGKSGKTKAK